MYTITISFFPQLSIHTKHEQKVKNPSRKEAKNFLPMAAVSSSTVTASFSINPSRKFTSLSSSSSVFFSYNITNRTGLGLDVGRPRRAKRRGLSCNCLFGLGVPELAVIAGVAALVFGPKQLPEVGRSFGKTIKSFQQAAKEFETELKKDTESSAEEPSSSDNRQ